MLRVEPCADVQVSVVMGDCPQASAVKNEVRQEIVTSLAKPFIEHLRDCRGPERQGL
jgi:hypothetical protein